MARRPIRTLLDSLDNNEFQLVDEVLLSYLDAVCTFPKPSGIEDVEMSKREMERYRNGWDAAIEMNVFVVALLLERTDEFIESRTPNDLDSDPG